MAAEKNDKISRNRRVIAIIVLTALLAVLLFSSCYIIEEADHDCTGASCHICAVMQQCENILRQIGAGRIAVAAIVFGVVFLCRMVCFVSAAACAETPITRKVRLNN